jgi:NADH-quinone oxidoreductase subunit L
LLGWRWYVQGRYPLNPQNHWIKAAENQLKLDTFYNKTVVKGTLSLSTISYWWDKNIVDGLVHGVATLTRALSRTIHWIDKNIVDGIVNTVAGVTYYMGHLLRWVQNGRIQNYLGFAFTIVLIGIVYLILR